jgi:hypothetical protein
MAKKSKTSLVLQFYIKNKTAHHKDETKSSKVKTMNKHKRKGRTKKQMRYRGQGKV